jgi:hypothetical protein
VAPDTPCRLRPPALFSLQRRYTTLLAVSFSTWRAHLLGEVAGKMKQLSALLHWERRLLAGALAGWRAGVAEARGRVGLELLAARHYVASMYLRALQVGVDAARWPGGGGGGGRVARLVLQLHDCAAELSRLHTKPYWPGMLH